MPHFCRWSKSVESAQSLQPTYSDARTLRYAMEGVFENRVNIVGRRHVMARWFSKRWVLASLAGASMTIGIAALRAADPPKVGSVISLNVDGKGERQFKVLKSDKQPDGSYLSELKDTKSGETITLLDKPNDN